MDETTYQSYRMGSTARLSENQMATLYHHLTSHGKATDTVLGGRGRPVHIDLDDYGPVTMKKYYRGGIIRHLVRQTYFRWGPSRPRTEFDMLNRVRKVGVNAPEPVVYITQGNRIYQGWLVMQRIDNSCSLAQQAAVDSLKIKTALTELARQVSLMIEHGIHHTDLHPGNVLVDNHGKVYIVDFDKTHTDIHNRDRLAQQYNRRWQRAISKHGLPNQLDRPIAGHLQWTG